MARRVQVFTRVTPEALATLEVIGREMDALLPNGEVNTSYVIRSLLGEADLRLKEA